MTNRKIDMCNGPLFKNIIIYTLPIMLTGVLQLLFNAADLVVVGQFATSKAVAAVGATGSLATLIVNLFIGISTGTGVTVAHALGAKDKKDTIRSVHTAIPTAIISGGIISIIGIIFCEPLLQMMNTPEDILPLSALYLRIYFGGMVFNMLYNFGAAILRAAGDTRSPLIYLTVAGFANVILNLIFVIVFNMDVAGVAIATTSAQAISAILVLRALIKRNDDCKLDIRKLKIHGRTLKKILAIGIPSGIQSCMFAISNVIIQASVNSFGTATVAGVAAATSIEGFVYIAMNSFYQASINFTGQNEGAKNYKRIKKILIICVLSTTVVGAFLGAIVYFFGVPLLSIYIKGADTAIGMGLAKTIKAIYPTVTIRTAIDLGMIKMALVGLTYFLCGIMESLTGSVRGMGCSLTPMITTIINICGVRLAWIFTVFVLPSFHNLYGLYLCYPLSWITASLALFVIFIYLYRKRVRPR